MPDVDCEEIEQSLAAMPPVVRDRVKLMLNGVEIQTEYDDPTMSFAARYILKLAQAMREQNPHPVTYEPHRWETEPSPAMRRERISRSPRGNSR